MERGIFKSNGGESYLRGFEEQTWLTQEELRVAGTARTDRWSTCLKRSDGGGECGIARWIVEREKG